MKKDEIVAEVRRIRDELAKEYNYDVDALIDGVRKRQKKSRRKVVSFVTKQKIA
jgi:hypothetical protein